MKDILNPYVWIKARVTQGPEPFVSLNINNVSLQNIIGKDDENKNVEDSKYLVLVRSWLNRYFRTKQVRLSEVPFWIDIVAYDYKHIKLKISLNDLRNCVHDFECFNDRGGDLLVRQIELPNINVGASIVKNFVSAAAKIQIARRQFVVSSTDIDWMVRLNKLWLQQASTYQINKVEQFKYFITNVVGGPRVKTLCGKSLGGFFYYTPARIDVTLPAKRVYNRSMKSINDMFKLMLVHEYTHFLQMMYVKANEDKDSSFWNLPSIGNVGKYYRSMWERDAYAVEFLYGFLKSKGFDLEALGSGETLGQIFTPEAFKNFLRKYSEYKWHQNRMKDKDSNEVWLNGLVYGATKFVTDMTANTPKDEVDIEIKKNYKAVVSFITKAQDEELQGDEFTDKMNKMQDKHDEMKDVPVEDVFVGDSYNANKYQAGISVSLETPRWSNDEIEAECMNLNIKPTPALIYCANIEGMTYHCGLSDAIKSANLYVD